MRLVILGSWIQNRVCNVGEVLVTQESGFARVLAINTTSNPVIINVAPVELEEFIEALPASRSARTGDPGVGQTRADARRLVELFKILDLDGLNDVEQASILEAINAFPYQFYLPSDELGSTVKSA